MAQLLKFVTLALTVAPWAFAFPAYRSLAGLSQEELDTIIPNLHIAPPEGPPPPPKDNSTRLVYDDAHPYIAPGPTDQRGPCPGFNTLANHGYLPRNGIATPAQLITAVQEGFNMANPLAGFLTYVGFIVDGNLLTNLVSIGGKDPRTGVDPPKPAIVGGMSSPGLFEGDISLTRLDSYFGDAISFNQDLWDQLVDYSNRYGGGKYNITVAGELHHQRILQSIATNPEFSYVNLRVNTAASETVFPINLFVDGRQDDGQLDLDAALSFFRDAKYPDGFFRAARPLSSDGAATVVNMHPFPPGRNMGKVNTFTPDPTSSNITTPCLLYNNFIETEVKPLYPAPTGVLREALARNLHYLYQFVDPSCTEVFPYGPYKL